MDLDSGEPFEERATGYLGTLAGVSLAVVLFVVMAAAVLAREGGMERPGRETGESPVATAGALVKDNTSDTITNSTSGPSVSYSAAQQNQDKSVVFYLVASRTEADALKATLAQSGDLSSGAEVVVIDSSENRFSMGATLLELTLAGTNAWTVDLR